MNYKKTYPLILNPPPPQLEQGFGFKRDKTLNYIPRFLNMPRELTPLERTRVLQRLGEGVSYAKINEEFHISMGTISNIKRAGLKQAGTDGMTITTSTEISRLKGDAAELDRRVFEWFGQARTRGLVVTGPMIQEKAKLVAIHMNISTFKASKGWLNRFQKRHNVYLRSISGESLGVPLAVAQS
jgi:uncharacterized protein YerC